MKTEVYVCDECGAQKRETNNWWLISSAELDVIRLSGWECGSSDADDTTHYCGRSCALQAIDRYMESGAVTASSQKLAARS